MQSFTFEQMKRAEGIAIELFSNIQTPLDAIASLATCLLCVAQQTYHPHYTMKEFEDAGTYMVAYYRLSPQFPYTNEEIADYIVELKKQPPPIWIT